MADQQNNNPSANATAGPASKPLGVNKELPKHMAEDQEKERYKMNFGNELENGPVENRGCTDIICCLLFLIFLIAWIVVFAYGLAKGDPSKLFIPYDEDRRGCGYDSGLKDYKYIFFYQLGKNATEWGNLTISSNYNSSAILINAFCVDKCPPSSYSDNTKTLSDLGIKCITKDNDSKTAEGKVCNTYKGYNSTIWFDGFCIPAFNTLQEFAKTHATSLLTVLEESETLQKWANDIKLCWWVFLVSFGITIVISIVYMYFLRCCAGIITWLMIIFLIAIFIIGGSMCWNWAKARQAKADIAAGSGIFVFNERNWYC